MKRLLRVLAVGAPVLGAGCWVMLDQGVASDAPTHRINDPQSPWYGRSRDLPATGPVAAPDGVGNELAFPLHRMQEFMPPPRADARGLEPRVAATSS